MFSGLQYIVLSTFLSLNPTWFLNQGWVFINKFFIKLKGAWSLIPLLDVLCWVLFMLLAISGLSVLLYIGGWGDFFWLQAKQLVDIVR